MTLEHPGIEAALTEGVFAAEGMGGSAERIHADAALVRGPFDRDAAHHRSTWEASPPLWSPRDGVSVVKGGSRGGGEHEVVGPITKK